MLGVGAGGAPAPPLVRAPPPPVAVAVVAPRLFPPLFSSSLSRRRWMPPTAAAKQKQGRRRWWSEAEQEEEEEEEEEYDDFFTGGSRSSSFGRELFDEPWFSKVFKTYGFLLPVMLASMLVATGPRAFLMAMAVPLAQSAVSFLLDAIWGRNGRRRPFQEAEEEEEDFRDYSSDFAEARGDRDSSSSSSYQSWVSDDFAAASADNEDYSTKKSSGGGKISGFGGWDELLDNEDYSTKKTGRSSGANTYHRTSRTADDAARRPGAPLSRRRPRRGRMSASSKYKQAPLLMRLMVAVFPFLGSWFRLL